MPEYVVQLTETVLYELYVEAASPETAERIARAYLHAEESPRDQEMVASWEKIDVDVEVTDVREAD
jgi:hypothetical protein